MKHWRRLARIIDDDVIDVVVIDDIGHVTTSTWVLDPLLVR